MGSRGELYGRSGKSVYELQNPSNRFALVSHMRMPHARHLVRMGAGVAAGNWKGAGVKVWDFASRKVVFGCREACPSVGHLQS